MAISDNVRHPFFRQSRIEYMYYSKTTDNIMKGLSIVSKKRILSKNNDRYTLGSFVIDCNLLFVSNLDMLKMSYQSNKVVLF